MKNMKKYRVPKAAITERGLKQLIKKAAKDHSSVGAWAQENGLTRQSVSAFFAKTQPPGLKIPEVLGYKPQVIFIPIKDEPIATAYPPRRTPTRVTGKTDLSKPPLEKRGLPRVDDRDATKQALKQRKKDRKRA
jgi:hypothetical protein